MTKDSNQSPAAAEQLPPGGGSYIRHEDGSLEQVAGTEPAKPYAHPVPTAAPVFTPAAGAADAA